MVLGRGAEGRARRKTQQNDSAGNRGWDRMHTMYLFVRMDQGWNPIQVSGRFLSLGTPLGQLKDAKGEPTHVGSPKNRQTY